MALPNYLDFQFHLSTKPDNFWDWKINPWNTSKYFLLSACYVNTMCIYYYAKFFIQCNGLNSVPLKFLLKL